MVLISVACHGHKQLFLAAYLTYCLTVFLPEVVRIQANFITKI